MGRTMKDSGIPWIGQIPTNWSVDKVKYHLQTHEYKGYPEATVLSLYRELGIVPKDSRDDNHNVTSEDTSKYKHVEVGNFVVNKMKAWQGSVAVSNYDGIVSPAYYVYKFSSNAFDKYYFHYLLRDKSYTPEFRRLSGGIREGQWDLSREGFRNIPVIIPPYEEQQAIAEYLDKKTTKIDAAIKEAQNLIEKYKDYKQSIITETVTKGLDPQVTMKDSGVEWIGMIPEHWETHPLYVYFDERKCLNYKMQEQNLLSLSYGKIVRKDINTNGGLLPESFTTYNIVESGDIIIRPTDLQNDKKSLRTGLVREKGIITSAYIALKPKYAQSSRYYQYMLHMADVCKVFYNMGNGVRQGLNYSEFSKLIMLSPPIPEQEAIADYLDDKCLQIDSVINKKENLISQLQEYKKSIIFEYVTGKKEVPNG